jgi:hypothetical protein
VTPETGSEEGLLVRAEPLTLAQSVCEELVDEVRIMDGALLLAADPAWAWAINTMLVMKDVRVSELRPAGDLRTA